MALKRSRGARDWPDGKHGLWSVLHRDHHLSVERALPVERLLDRIANFVLPQEELVNLLVVQLFGLDPCLAQYLNQHAI